MATPSAVRVWDCGRSVEGHAAVDDKKDTADTHDSPDVEQSPTMATTTYSNVETDTILNLFLEVPYGQLAEVAQHFLPRRKHIGACAVWRRCV